VARILVHIRLTECTISPRRDQHHEQQFLLVDILKQLHFSPLRELTFLLVQPWITLDSFYLLSQPLRIISNEKYGLDTQHGRWELIRKFHTENQNHGPCINRKNYIRKFWPNIGAREEEEDSFQIANCLQILEHLDSSLHWLPKVCSVEIKLWRLRQQDSVLIYQTTKCHIPEELRFSGTVQRELTIYKRVGNNVEFNRPLLLWQLHPVLSDQPEIEC
jgi:hypothetical protein